MKTAKAEKTKPEDKKAIKEKKKKNRAKVTGEQLACIRRKEAARLIWHIFRIMILFGLCFVILYPLLFMISCAFRKQADMNDPTVMWIPRHLTFSVIKETADAMNLKTTLFNTIKLNIGCSLIQVVTTAVTGYGFARFKFKGKNHVSRNYLYNEGRFKSLSAQPICAKKYLFILFLWRKNWSFRSERFW